MPYRHHAWTRSPKAVPKGRPTLLRGTAACGKTVLAMKFLVRGATEFNEHGVFMALEETDKEMTEGAVFYFTLGLPVQADSKAQAVRVGGRD